ncbi:transcription initiation factor TFIID subunit 12 [Trichomonascus vanleenenianus]|uniref:Taf12p n=1 Tax=Trichomonascus vanleenenianus TaxID=2268995 RepID=UPI003ECB93A3
MNNGQQNQNQNPQAAIQQQRIANLTPTHINELFLRYQREMAEVSRCGPQSEEGQQHFIQAQRIKTILQQYQAQAHRRQQGQQPQQAQGQQAQPQQQPQAQQNMAARNQAAQRTQMPQAQRAQASPAPVNAQQSPPPPQQAAARPTPAASQPVNAQGLTQQQLLARQRQQQHFNSLNPEQQQQFRIRQIEQFRQYQKEYEANIQTVNQQMASVSTPEERSKLQHQLTSLRTKVNQFKLAETNVMSQYQRTQQELDAAQSGGGAGGTGAAASAAQNNAAQPQPQQQVNRQGSPPQVGSPAVGTPTLQQQQMGYGSASSSPAAAVNRGMTMAGAAQRSAQQVNAPMNRGTPTAATMGSRSQTPGGASASPPTTAAAIARPSAAGPSARPNPPTALQPTPATNRQPIQSISINNELNTKPPQAVAARPGRPTLTGGMGTTSAALATPAIAKVPSYELNGDRVLSKRKLRELVSSVVGDEDTQIDGDVEELLLDLADEFVTSTTSFACRLAKHRKSDQLEAKDLQLHLERNWNIRVPGYNADEIRSVRKIQPTQSYMQKIQGVNVSKSVGGKGM